ncbi:MFS transporter [Paraburkholderia susongensis]|uniref:Predicted arabinose efflux permease, MFS family n=1 Tax=Paraburkholderia susongensis TaxID=1515439 RepID=A0A1X7IQC1_9BURK|nr:MFS transporter [Paraburkholderia susongensis]SMG17222.1 Predicted arabinose efflux permease, MFS family [Paraburkholderia susongensis]
MDTASEASRIRKVIVTTVAGGTFEWFDFSVYAFFSGIIARTFFPAVSRGESLLLTFATFAVGFLMRPIGGVVMGMYADRAGRVKALSWIMVAMSMASLLLALTPGYATIGAVAPVLVVAGRLAQGFAVGAQFALSSVTIYEVAPPGKKMFYGSFNMLSLGFATILSSGFSYLLSSHLSHEALAAWGWRIPFLIGALVGPIGFYIRHHVNESDDFHRMQARPAAQAPALARARQFVRENGDALVCAMGVMIAGTSLNYVWHAYLPNYAQFHLHLSLGSTLKGVLVTSLATTMLSPLFGLLADRVGAYRLFCFFIAGWLVCVFPLFWFLLAQPSEQRLMFVQIVGTLFLTLQGAAHPGMLVKIFTVQGRSTGVAIAYNTAVMLFGGLAPFYISMVARFTDASYLPPSYLFGTSLLAIALVLLSRTGRRTLRDDWKGGEYAASTSDYSSSAAAVPSREHTHLRSSCRERSYCDTTQLPGDFEGLGDRSRL